MAKFILIHGGMHGGWCWEKIVPRLRAAGHQALAPTLPGMAPDDTIPADQVTLTVYGEYVARVASEQSDAVVLVGHSMGGLAISEAAERVTQGILGLIYVSAVLIPPGRTMFGTFREHTTSTGVAVPSADGATLHIVPQIAPKVFYNRCSPSDISAALARIRPQPAKSGHEPVTVTQERFGRIPRAYIECLQDNAMPLKFQRTLQNLQPCEPVFSIDTDHSPFYSAPDELTRYLIQATDAFRAAAAATAQ